MRWKFAGSSTKPCSGLRRKSRCKEVICSVEMFRKGLEQDPQFTAIRVGLGKTLLKLSRVAEARRDLQAILDEKAPSNPADWQLRDLREARDLLASTKGES